MNRVDRLFPNIKKETPLIESSTLDRKYRLSSSDDVITTNNSKLDRWGKSGVPTHGDVYWNIKEVLTKKGELRKELEEKGTLEAMDNLMKKFNTWELIWVFIENNNTALFGEGTYKLRPCIVYSPIEDEDFFDMHNRVPIIPLEGDHELSKTNKQDKRKYMELPNPWKYGLSDKLYLNIENIRDVFLKDADITFTRFMFIAKKIVIDEKNPTLIPILLDQKTQSKVIEITKHPDIVEM